jgi:two-component system, NtrC family, sensor kinase
LSTDILAPDAFRFDLAAESITLKIRWFGVCIGFALVNLISNEALPPGVSRNVAVLNGLLAIGAVYASVDTLLSVRGRVFLSDRPLGVSLLETIFIGLLCYFDVGQESAFRFYYFLSVVVCAIRHPPRVTSGSFLLHAASYTALMLALPSSSFLPWIITIVSIGWVTWASTRLAELVRTASVRLAEANELLEERIAARTQELRESQAMLVQHEKQAAFGLLAAGIAHEVGNPLAAISSLVQILKRRTSDAYTVERYQMMGDQLRRIQGIVRELVDFSRPANPERSFCDVHRMIEEALSISKYYKRRKGKRIITRYAPGLPALRVVHDQLVQILLNLILNAMDATSEGGTIEIVTSLESGWIRISVCDTGHGIAEEHQAKIFDPYFTTKATGTGLGLFVCRHVLERSSSGTIELTSSGTEGTTFSVMVTCEKVRIHPDIPAPETGEDHVLSVAENILPGKSDSDHDGV